jgi:hypothetical protein
LVGVVISAAVTGAINGGVFSTVLAIAGRRKTFESLSLPWIAACGAIGAVVLPVVVRSVLLSTIGVDLPITAFVGMLATNAALGAGFAAASLAVARRAPALRDGSDSDTPSVDSDSAERQLGVGEHSAIASAPRRLA